MPSSKPPLAWLAIVTGAVMLVFTWLPSHQPDEQPVSALQGNQVSTTPLPAPILSPAGGRQSAGRRQGVGTRPKPAQGPKPVPPSKPVLMTFPSVGLTLPLGEMQAVAGVIDPPTPDIGYWVSNRGVLPATNSGGSVFAACHTWEHGEKPCNKLSDPADPSRTIQRGAPIIVRTHTGTLTYTVVNVQTVSKQDVAANRVPDVRCSVPDHLIVMTCVWPDNGENFIVTAVLQGKKYVAADC
jgi:hypothetical protein